MHHPVQLMFPRRQFMSQIIDAIYEDGVFKPSQHVYVKEHEKVAIKVVLIDEWQERFNKIIKKLHDRAIHYTVS